MRLGIVVTDSAYLNIVNGLLNAARGRDLRTECFLTDTGVLLLSDDEFVTHARAVPGSVSVCEHSIERYAEGALDMHTLAEEIVVGGQYQDAELVSRCDKVVVF